jgi:hypothetical protein
MESTMYHHMVDRIEKVNSLREAESLRREIVAAFGDTQRRRMLLAALEDRRNVLRRPSRRRRSRGT